MPDKNYKNKKNMSHLLEQLKLRNILQLNDLLKGYCDLSVGNKIGGEFHQRGFATKGATTFSLSPIFRMLIMFS